MPEIESLLNVTLALQEDGNYEANLLIYDITQEELEVYRNGEFIDLSSKAFYMPLDLENEIIDFLTNRSFSIRARETCSYWQNCNGTDCDIYENKTGCEDIYGEGGCSELIVSCPKPATGEIGNGSTEETGGGGNTNTTNNNDNSTNGNGTSGDETKNSTGGGSSTGNGSETTTTNDNTTNDNSQDDNQTADDDIGGGDFETNPFGDASISPFRILINQINALLDGPDLSANQEQFLYENIEYAQEVLNALENGGEYIPEEQVILDPSIPDCVKNIIDAISMDDVFLDIGDMPGIVLEQLNLAGLAMSTFNHSDNYSLIFKMVNLGGTKNAETNPIPDPNNIGKFIITITLDSSFVTNGTNLVIARTIIHESLHAYLTWVTQEDFLGTLALRIQRIASDLNLNTNDAQHIEMSNSFVNAISRSLENWHNSALADNLY